MGDFYTYLAHGIPLFRNLAVLGLCASNSLFGQIVSSAHILNEINRYPIDDTKGINAFKSYMENDPLAIHRPIPVKLYHVGQLMRHNIRKASMGQNDQSLYGTVGEYYLSRFFYERIQKPPMQNIYTKYYTNSKVRQDHCLEAIRQSKFRLSRYDMFATVLFDMFQETKMNWMIVPLDINHIQRTDIMGAVIMNLYHDASEIRPISMKNLMKDVFLSVLRNDNVDLADMDNTNIIFGNASPKIPKNLADGVLTHSLKINGQNYDYKIRSISFILEEEYSMTVANIRNLPRSHSSIPENQDRIKHCEDENINVFAKYYDMMVGLYSLQTESRQTIRDLMKMICTKFTTNNIIPFLNVKSINNCHYFTIMKKIDKWYENAASILLDRATDTEMEITTTLKGLSLKP
ncbi:hypothetical protein SNEBB_002980 [Seison nebaliae]|nr:hypothetical protein SNEBB_002980 [Seison nebaliae]